MKLLEAIALRAVQLAIMLAIVWAFWPLLFMFANDGVRP